MADHASATHATTTIANPTNVNELPEPAPIEAIPDLSEVDSAYGGDAVSFTTSLNSLVTDYEYEHGRRFHGFKKGSYFLPNDEQETWRLDLYHHLILAHCDNKLHLAPIGANPQSILDVGTGTGKWAIDMGDTYPSAEIIGNDLSPIQPSLVPPNVSFEVDDVEQPWIYSRKFDLIHVRTMNGSLSSYPDLISNCYNFLKPGGWVEMKDFDMTFYTEDNSLPSDSALVQWTHEIREGVRGMGREPEPGPQLLSWMIAHGGFTNITHRRVTFPVGTWPKDQKMKERGNLDLANFLEGLEGFSIRVMTNVRGWSYPEVQVLLAKCKQELLDNKIHKLHDMHVVYAQKP